MSQPNHHWVLLFIWFSNLKMHRCTIEWGSGFPKRLLQQWKRHLQVSTSPGEVFLFGSCMFGVFLCCLCSRFCPLGSVAAWVVPGDRTQLGLAVISGRFQTPAPELLCWIVFLPADWCLDLDPTSHGLFFVSVFSFPRLPRSQWRVYVLVFRYSAVEPNL